MKDPINDQVQNIWRLVDIEANILTSTRTACHNIHVPLRILPGKWLKKINKSLNTPVLTGETKWIRIKLHVVYNRGSMLFSTNCTPKYMLC